VNPIERTIERAWSNALEKMVCQEITPEKLDQIEQDLIQFEVFVIRLTCGNTLTEKP
jgi:hypothetical protein